MIPDSTNPQTKIFGKARAEVEAEFNKNIGDLVDEFLAENRTTTFSYKDVRFEERAYREEGEGDKALLTYDMSLDRIKKAGLARHARSQEVFGLIIDGLEGKLDANLGKVRDDFSVSYGEWLSCAFERQGDTLIVYVDPEGLVFNGSTYVKTGKFKCSDKKEFSVQKISPQTLTKLNEFSEELIVYIYGRKFEQLPGEIQNRAVMCLPQKGGIRPVGRGSFENYNVITYINSRASCGVAVGAKKVS